MCLAKVENFSVKLPRTIARVEFYLFANTHAKQASTILWRLVLCTCACAPCILVPRIEN